MKRLSALALALSLCAIPAWSGDDCGSGTDCTNSCPLAKQANNRLATGTEALSVSTTVRKDFVDAMLRCANAI
jgi:hypothetical protein